VQYLNQDQAQQLDADLMGPEMGFSIDQLMELAGLSVASVVSKAYPVEKHRRVLAVAGPGNNGGDALVACRHLVHFGYSPCVVYPKPGKTELFKNLVKQCSALHVPILDALPANFDNSFDLILDGIFGFSFKGDIRAPFDSIIKDLNLSKLPVIAIDIPSGWDVEKGDISGAGLRAETLISLTAPKLCAKQFRGKFHFLGGRFVPPAITEKYRLQLPRYPGCEQCVSINDADMRRPSDDSKSSL